MMEEVVREAVVVPRTVSPLARAKRGDYLTGTAASCGILAAALLVMFWHNAGGLWRDEVNSVNFANLPSLRLMWQHLDSESFPLFWLLLERAWSSVLGTSDAVLRAIGLGTALAMVAAVWWGGKKWGYAPALALALVADNPVLLRAALVNRAYGLGFVLTVLCYHVLWGVARQRTRRRIWIAGALCLCLTQTLYYGIVFVGALLLGALAVRWRQGDRRAVWPLLGIGAVCVLSLVPYVFGPIHAERAWSFVIGYKMPGWQVWDVIEQTLHLQSQSQPCTGGTVVASAAWIALAALALFALTGFGRRAERWWSDSGDMARFASVTVLISLAGMGAALSVVGYMIEPFHLSAVVILIIVALDHLTTTARPSWIGRIAAPAVGILLVATNIGQVYQAMQVRQSNADMIAAVVNTQARPGDFVLVAPYWLGQPFARYYHGRAPWTTPPPLPQYAYGGEPYILQDMRYPHPGLSAQARITSALKQGHRVWLVDGVNQFPAPWGTPRLLPLLPPYSPKSHANFHDFLVRLMQRDAFALRHATQRELIAVPMNQPVNPEEHLEINCFWGWSPYTQPPLDVTRVDGPYSPAIERILTQQRALQTQLNRLLQKTRR